MKQCWLRDKQRPTMKEIVQIVKNWSPDTWDSDVVSASPEPEWAFSLVFVHKNTNK